MDTLSYMCKWAKEAHRVATAQNSTLVVLGRDCWPMVPYLRSQGKTCQYFLASRLQSNADDESTKAQWIREVPTNSFVVDTGYVGSIPLWLTSFDATIAGVSLMSSAENANYGQMTFWNLGQISHSDIVSNIEHLPKHVNRCCGYDSNGNAIFSDNISDSGYSDNPSKVIPQNYLMLRQMGLSINDSHRYATFSGETIEERTGLTRDHAAREHVLQVKRMRSKVSRDDVIYMMRHAHHLGRYFDVRSWVMDHLPDFLISGIGDKIRKLRYDLEGAVQSTSAALLAAKLEEREDLEAQLERRQARLTFANTALDVVDSLWLTNENRQQYLRN